MSKKINQRALLKHKKRFLKIFPKGFNDQRYIEWERTYKWEAHLLWKKLLGQEEFLSLLKKRDYSTIASRALQVESRCTFLFSFEKMALRDALNMGDGARTFAEGLYNLLHGKDPFRERFVAWIVAVSELPRKKSRVLSWPVLTFFPYIAQPNKFMIMKPTAMRVASEELGFDLEYSSKPNFRTYELLMDLAEQTKAGIADLKPKNFHDIQTFLWVIGSAEYERLEAEIDGVEFED